MIEFVEFLDHNHYALAATSTSKCELDEFFVFEPVKHQQTVRRLLEGQRRVKFRLGTSLKPKVVARTFPQIFLNHRSLLVHFHRVDTQVRALVVKFTYRPAEGALKFSDLGGNQLRESQEHGRTDASACQIIHYLF